MHPGAWFLWALSAGTVVVTTTNPFYLLPVFGATWMVHATHMKDGPNARSFRFFVIFGLITIVTRTGLVLFGRVSEEAVAAAFLEGLRLAVLLAVFGTFNSISDPFRVLRLAPRRFHEAALAAALALSLTPRTIDSLGRVREAQRLRGMDTKRWSSWAALAIPVLSSGMEEAVTLAESMDARGHGRGRRSSYRPESWSPRSIAVAVTSGVAAVTFVAFAFRGLGGLYVSTFPLVWPEASAVLVGTALALAFPAVLRAESPR
jgi:energy-coupling factor transport system permease protein